MSRTDAVRRPSMKWIAGLTAALAVGLAASRVAARAADDDPAPGAAPPPAAAPTPTTPAPAAAATAAIQWFGTWEQGKREAARTGRPILLLAAAPQCHGVSGLW